MIRWLWLLPLGTNIFLCHRETIWLKRYPKKFRPKYYKNFLDYIIVLFEKSEHLQQFAEYLNKQQPNTRFSVNIDKNGSLPFLDIKIYRENGKVLTGVHKKKTLSGLCINFTSFILLGYKFGVSYTLFHRCFCLVFDFSKFHIELEKLKKLITKKVYPQKFIDKCIFKLLSRMFQHKPKVTTVPHNELRTVRPYLGNMSNITKTNLTI